MDLTSVTRKLEWARHHFNSVDDEIKTWLNNEPYSVKGENNEQYTKFWLRVRINGNPDFNRWSLMIGDCLTNLRDTLDHLIYGIAHLPTSPCIDPKVRDRAAFIIRTDPAQFIKDSKSRLACVSKVVCDSVLSFQPFNRPCHLLPPLLQILSELANGNKHKVLSVALVSPAVVDVQFDSPSGFVQQPRYEICEREIEDGTILFTLHLPSPDPLLKLHPKSKVGLNVAVRHNPLNSRTTFDANRTAYDELIPGIFREVELVIDTISKLL